MSIEEKLVNFVSSITYNDLSPEVILAGKKSIVDVLGVSIAGSAALAVKEMVNLVKEWDGKPESTVFLYDAMAPAHQAVLVNSTMARALDFDEYHMSSGTHPIPTMVPVALATAELCGKVTGKEFITAVVMGSEVMCRMRSVPDYCTGLSGWVGDICGVFGAAAAAGKLMRLSSEEMTNALGLAYSQAAGNVQGVRDGGGGLTLALQQGFSARSGLLSAILAQRGIGGAKNFLEGQAGLYKTYYRGIPYDINRLLDGLGETYDILNLATKPYPCTGYINGPIENVIEIMRQNQLSGEDIDKVVLRVNQAMYNNTCQPREVKYRPKTGADAMFSLPYAVGSAIFRGDVFLEDFTSEAVKDARRLSEVDKVEIVLDPGIEEEASKLNLRLSLHVAEVKTKNGKSVSQKMLYAKGFPQKPMTLEDCAEKARRCAHFAVKEFSENRVSQLVEMVKSLEQLEDVRSLTKLLY